VVSIPNELDSLPFPFPVVIWEDQQVVLLDQTVLPERLAWRRCADIPTLCQGILDLAVRGAPAIGVAAAYGMALSWSLARSGVGDDVTKILPIFAQHRQELASTRPTAVNLFWALDRCAKMVERMVSSSKNAAEIAEALVVEAAAIREEDVAMCRALGQAGAALLPERAAVLTHCNAGGLATGGYGTALGVIYAAKEAGKIVQVYADETRPLLQGARLTAWELMNQGVEVTVICDSAAATVLQQGKVDAVITGADRVAANGDAANKIGTYPLAVMAHRHNIPFYIAAPASTFDPNTPDGAGIKIEERDPSEVAQWREHSSTPKGTKAWNPAFDVTPASLITAFITESGVLRPPFDQSLEPVLKRARLS
jgi:methylthioribose-1-phosphate isomerase